MLLFQDMFLKNVMIIIDNMILKEGIILKELALLKTHKKLVCQFNNLHKPLDFSVKGFYIMFIDTEIT